MSLPSLRVRSEAWFAFERTSPPFPIDEVSVEPGTGEPTTTNTTSEIPGAAIMVARTESVTRGRVQTAPSSRWPGYESAQR